MELKIGKGIAPAELPGVAGSGIFEPMRAALINAAVNEWLYIDFGNGDKKEAERYRSAVTSGSNTRSMQQMRDAGFRTRTAIRTWQQDENVPRDCIRLYFCKVRPD